MRNHTRVGLMAAVGLIYVTLPARAQVPPAHPAADARQEAAAGDAKGKQIPTVQLVHPSVRNIVRVVGQPSFVESYERTAIYPKLTAYVERWNVDIGDRVKFGDVLAKLSAPEIVEDYEMKKATVKLDHERLGLALGVSKVAEADLRAAEAHVKEAQSVLSKYQAEVDRWDAEVKRLKREVGRGVVAAEVLQESNNQLKSSTAAHDSAKAAIEKSEAELLSRRVALARAELDIKVSKAALSVSQSEERRLKAWVGYLTLTAPFDGVIVAHNANTFDLVQPALGAVPIFVVAREDIVRIFVDIPERDANYVHVGTKASVLVPAYRQRPIPAAIVRTSWALNSKSRTLRAEIDLPTPGSQLLPGMYANVKVVIERLLPSHCPLASS